MTDRKNFEAMLEALINEDQQAARDIFHNIVVAKSRQIYETLLAEDFDLYEKEDEEDDADEPDLDDTDSEEDEDPELGDMDLGDEEDEDPEMGDMDIEDEDEGDLEDRVLDLEDALEDLKAEFEELMADSEGEDEFDDEEPEMGDMDLGDEDEEEPGMGDMDLGDEDEFGSEDEFSRSMGSSGGMSRNKPVYEYVNKVSPPKHGDNGVNTKSPVAKANKMGGTSANIVSGGESKGGGTKGGLLNPSTKEEDFGNMNKPGANVGKTAFKKRVSAPSAGKAAADRGAGSPISGLKSRSK